MLKAVIFDFDGVIADSEPLHFRACKQTLANYKVRLSQKDYYNEYLGYNDHDFFVQFMTAYPDKFAAATVDQLMEQKSAAYLELIEGRNIVIRGVAKFIGMLIHQNILMAICSGGRRKEIEQILVKGRLLEFFKLIVSADEVAVGKPDPEGFILTLKLLSANHPGMNIEAGDCVVIEDSRWGIEAAKKAGMHTIAVATSYDTDELAMAEIVVSDLKRLVFQDIANLSR